MKKKVLCYFARIGCFLIGKFCSLHIGHGQETGKITLLREETLEKCKFTLALRKQHNLKYKNVVLPIAVDSFYWFHLDCYKRFTALSATLRKDRFRKIRFQQKTVRPHLHVVRDQQAQILKLKVQVVLLRNHV